MIRNLLALLGLMTLVFGGAIAAYANRDAFVWGEPQAVAVSFDGLDLSSPEGRRLLDNRLRLSLDRVCGRVTDASELFMRASIRKCRRDAWIGTRTQVAAAVDVALRPRQFADERERDIAPPVRNGGF